ncbi:MAG TPA: T9SS type A sorting domain-containing protein, partial [Chitinophagaceae bacterium]|nr:T9SS type A sorting domain-containing protein [Chitinophagaceae bacterium]
VTDCYCIPNATSGDYLNTIDIETDIDNHLYTASSQPTNPIKGYDDQLSQVIETYVGDEVEVNTLYTGGNNTVKIWVDWNEDGVFDEVNELMDEGYVSSATTVNDLSFIVPNGVAAGDYRMRIRGRWSTTNFTPCSTETYGSAVDFTLRVITLSGCTDADAGTISSTATEACSDEDFTLTASGMTGPGNGLTYQWQESPSGLNTWTDIAGANSPNLTINGVSDDTDYRFVVACSFGNLEDISNMVTVNAKPVTECYCLPVYTSIIDYLSAISIEGSIDNLNYAAGAQPNNPVMGYDDRSSEIFETFEGDTINVNTSYVGGSNTVRIWVDWNQNGVFDATELMDQNNVSGADNNLSFVVPSGMSAGNYRMRIRGVYDFSNTNNFDACSTETWGSAVDYTLKVGTPLPVEMDALKGSVNAHNQAVLTWKTYQERDNAGFYIEKSFDGTSFENVGFVATMAKDGNSDFAIDYTYLDGDALNKITYYRLKQMDIDGKMSYSNVLVLQPIKNANALTINAYPNPLKDQVQIRINGALGTNAKISITDVSGREVYKAEQVNNIMNVDMKTVPAGIYFLKYQDDNVQQQVKLIKN